jgi:sortase A
MFGKQKLNKLSVEELEKVLLIKKRQARLDRFQRLSEAGYSPNEALVGQGAPSPNLSVSQSTSAKSTPLAVTGFQTAVMHPLSGRRGNGQQKGGNDKESQERTRSKKIRDTLLLGLEVASVVGLVAVLVTSYFNLRELNDEVSIAQQNAITTREISPPPTTPPPITLAQLPGGHSSPTSPGGAVPDVPPHLQQWVQPSDSPASTVSIPFEQKSNPPTRIVIPKIKIDAPIVAGVTWEDLKKGVGHLPGSANPGERGNLYLAAHNDIFGEIFRHLDKLEPGDEYFIYGGEQKFRYVVKEKRIIEPTEVDVMRPTTEPVATLQSCYPYLIDTHRIVVIGELAE